MFIKAAPVPWASSIIPLLKYGMSNHPLAEAINFERKLEILKLIKVKYGWPADSSGNELTFIFRIIKMNLSDLFDDIKIVIKSCTKVELQANFHSTYEVAKRGEIERAFNYLQSLEIHDRRRIIEMTINIATKFLDDGSLIETEADSILEYWNLIVHNYPEFDGRELKTIKNILCLRQNFKLELNLEYLQNKINLPAILKLGFKHILDTIKSHKNDNYIEEIWQKIHLLIVLLEIDAIYGVVEICKHMDDLKFSCCITYMLLNTELNQNDTDRIIDLAALLLAQQINAENIDFIEFLDPFVFPLIERLLSHAFVSNQNKIMYIEIYHFMQLVRIGSTFYESNVLDNKLNYFKKISETSLNRYYDLNISSSIVKNSSNQKHRRESMSIFDTAIEPSNGAVTSVIQKDPESVLNFILYSMKILIHVIKVSSGPFVRIIKFISETAPSDIEK